MSGTVEFAILMRRICEQMIQLHEMDEDWVAMEAVLLELSRLAHSAAQCAREAGTARPALELE